jgi:hypothetical protein
MKIYAGIVSPEKMGVMGSRWMIVENDTITVTNMRVHQICIADFKARGYEIVYVDNETVKQMVRNLT